MGTTISKTQLLAELKDENASWLALLDDIGEDNMTQPEVAGGWSIKDIVAHITGWRRRTVRRLQAALNNEQEVTMPWPPELEEVDDINAWIYEANRDRSLAEVLRDSDEVFQQMVDALAAFPEEKIEALQRFGWLEGEPLSGKLFFAHFHEEHEADMRAWLARVKSGR